MSIEILQSLLKEFAKKGTVSEVEKKILSQKAQEMGISQEALNILIEDEINKSLASSVGEDQQLSSGFVSEDDVIDQQLSSGFVTEDDDINSPEPQGQKHQGDFFTNVKLLSQQGSMSDVYQGKRHNKKVIIKRIKEKYRQDATYKDLFYKEFYNAYDLDHEHIVKLIDKGEDRQGAFYYMEYIDGRPLTEMIGAQGLNNEKLAKKILLQILDATAYIHKKQIFHRDLKPDNILVTYKGDNVKILDFGVAAADSFDDKLKTVGTPKYAPPEQRDKGYTADARSDIYSIGLIFLEMLTGQANKINILQIKDQDLVAVILKATDEDPEKRFENCEEIIDVLNRLRSNETSTFVEYPEKEVRQTPPKEVDTQTNKQTTGFQTVDSTQREQTKSHPHPGITSEKPKKPKKSNKTLVWLIVIIVGGGGIWLLYDHFSGGGASYRSPGGGYSRSSGGGYSRSSGGGSGYSAGYDEEGRGYDYTSPDTAVQEEPDHSEAIEAESRSDGDNLVVWWNDLSNEWQSAFKENIDLKGELTVREIREVVRISKLDISYRNIQNLEPLTELHNLTWLNCEGLPITDLSPLKDMENLWWLNLKKTYISELSPLSGIESLTDLSISSTGVSNLKPLSNLRKLKKLYVYDTNVRSLGALKHISGLRELHFNNLSQTEISRFKRDHPNCKLKERND